AALRGELRDHRRQILVVERRKGTNRDRPRPCGRAIEQAEQRFRSADITCEQHLILTSRQFSFILSSVSFDLSVRGRLASPSPDLPGSAPLAGQLVVFTGKLSSLGRKEARALVARLGGGTADDVNAKTTMLVIGAEGFRANADETPEEAAVAVNRDKSHKLRRAEELNAQAGPSQIIRSVSE